MISTSIFDGMLFEIFGFKIMGSVVLTWGLMFALGCASFFLTRDLKREPEALQMALEGAVTAMEDAIESVLPGRVALVFPFVATLWTFILFANLIGLVPGLSSPTSDLSVTAALAFLVFLSVHWFGMRANGWSKYLKHYLTPNPIMLPFHLISEVSRTVALAMRLFGNVMSLEIAAVLVLMVAGLLVPVPLLMLHIVEALIQAYLFGMLALIYIAGGIQSQELQLQKEGSS